jgi:CDGSH-type Zn-finger protein
MADAVVAGNAPIAVDVEEGKSYWWCACGRSSRQPFCDGAHKDTGFEPVQYKADATRKVFFCACKQTAGQPLCDGAHSKL